ncbi:putative ribonuclease H-like domain-containing protein [Tanacetum coccineum]|uniref:Ribonuclease H-like domain-containing protein n=1 Tax=Tanacetum coccineum TaxID=301880 RepID=A0ABQ5CPT8_9ASTR
MSTDKESSAAGTDNRPPMLVESDYDSWKIRIHRYIRGKPLGKLIWNSIQNGPSPHPMVTDAPTEGQTGVNMPRMKLDSEFTPEETNRKNADTQTEIILRKGLPRHIFNILNQTNNAKEIWDNVEMLMQGSGRTLQQRKEDLFDEFERFCAIGNEPIHDYFVRFHKLVNDIKITHLVTHRQRLVDSDDETDVSESQKETTFNSENSETSFENRSPNSQNNVGQESRTKGLGNKGRIWVKKGSTVGTQVVLPQTVKESAMIKSNQTWRLKEAYLDSVNRDNGSYTLKQFEYGNPEEDLKDYAIIDSGCSGSMTGDKDKLSDFKEFKGGYVAFGNDSKGGRISGKGTIKTSCLDFEKVSYVEELKFNLLSVSQICDKKHNVLFTDKECLILSPKFKFVDEDLVILRAPRKNDVYSLDLKNIIPSGGITCLVAKATEDEAVLWHRRLGHVNFKNINKLVKGNLVRGLPSKTFKLDHSCVACRKGKQHRASCKKIEERTVREPLELLHMDLFGPVSVESINKKKYCLVVTDDCSKFSWVFFLAYKDETYDMLHDLIVGLENRLRHKVKTIRCDHGTEFKNQLMNEFCAKKGIKREYSIARTPQQNGVAERKNRTLIEAARTMLADSLLPIQFWAEAVNTACYVLNRVLVTKPQMKTPYEILMGRSPNISFMRPFGCSLTILNTLDHLGKFDGKSEEGYLLGYSTNSKGFRVYNRVTRKVQDCLHVNFLENQENQKGKGPDWMFDLDLLTPSMCLYISYDSNSYSYHTSLCPPEERTSANEVTLGKEENNPNAKGKEHVDSTFHLSTANTPPQSTGHTPTDTDDGETPQMFYTLQNSLDAEEWW